jgi:uncharacterized repeat protein (TIGR03837 family)
VHTTTPPPPHVSPALRWDVFCRVVDNLGDVGVCWRLAADLAQRGDTVRLVIDDASALAWMAPNGQTGVQVVPWSPAVAACQAPADVVVEAFGCDLPSPYVQAMAQQRPRPVWLNLEYLSAEPYVQRSHGLPSPQANGLVKWFFYPGFYEGTGGLLLEATLPARQQVFDRHAWLATQGITLRACVHGHERVVSLFCYDNPAVPEFLSQLAQPHQPPTLLLATPGHGQRLASTWLRSAPAGRLRVHPLPWLTQADYDHLLWASDLNCVRGEDSLVRAIWAAKPLVWQAYVQSDGAHHAKVRAMLQAQAADPGVAAFWQVWNQLPGSSRQPLAIPELATWQLQVAAWGGRLAQQGDLASSLRRFVWGKRARS